MSAWNRDALIRSTSRALVRPRLQPLWLHWGVLLVPWELSGCRDQKHWPSFPVFSVPAGGKKARIWVRVHGGPPAMSSSTVSFCTKGIWWTRYNQLHFLSSCSDYCHFLNWRQSKMFRISALILVILIIMIVYSEFEIIVWNPNVQCKL